MLDIVLTTDYLATSRTAPESAISRRPPWESMSKRKLTRRQRWRIDKIQQDKLARAARREARDASDTESTAGDEQAGLVVTHFGQQVMVESDSGQTYRCHFRANLAALVVGDRILFQPPDSDADNDLGVVTALQTRTTELRRPDPYGNLKPVAANVDLMVITYAPIPAPSSVLLDRYLVAAELSGIRPLLLLNKADLVDEALAPLMDELEQLYSPLGYTVMKVSAADGNNLEPLRDVLAGHTSVFVGQSGVGKSSLINALLPDAELDVQSVSEQSGLGQHTTVTARLFHLPEGGQLIDSPGVREFGLWHINEEELLRGYVDLAPLAAQCRFRNCSHHHEPGCALQQAAEDGRVSAERLSNFFHIAATLDEEARQRY